MATERESPVLAKLEAVGGDARILEALGGHSDTKSLALPVKVDDSVILVLFGDEFSEGLSTGWIELLEVSVLETIRDSLASRSASIVAS